MQRHHSHLWPTLYIPGTKKPGTILPLVQGERESVRNAVICFEDSVLTKDLPQAFRNLDVVLAKLEPGGCDVYVRIRDLEVLQALLERKHIHKVAGFVIPKVHPNTFPVYANLIIRQRADYSLMPIMEASGLASQRLREALLDMFMSDRYRPSIETLRIGANDLSGSQGLRQDEDFPITESVVWTLIATMVNEFRTLGNFEFTAPVYDGYSEDQLDTFRAVVDIFVKNRLLGQTIIHPKQADELLKLYKVAEKKYKDALLVVGSKEAVYGHSGSMQEPATHRKAAVYLIERAKLFGVIPDPNPEH